MKTRKGNVAVMVVIAVVILATVGVIGWMFVKKSQAPAPQPEVLTTLHPATPVDETVTWQTYISPAYGFSFQYPKSLQLSINQSDSGVFSSSVEPYGGAVVSFDMPTKDPTWNSQSISSYTALRVYLVSKSKLSQLLSDCKKGSIASVVCQTEKIAENDTFVVWMSNFNQDAPSDAINVDVLGKIVATFKFTK